MAPGEPLHRLDRLAGEQLQDQVAVVRCIHGADDRAEVLADGFELVFAEVDQVQDRFGRKVAWFEPSALAGEQ